MTRPTDIDQEERAVGAAFRDALPPPPGTTDPDALDAAFLGSLRAVPSAHPPPPDLAPRLAGIARRALARARRRALLRRAAALLLAVLLLAGCAAAATRLWRELDFSDAGRADGTHEWVAGHRWELVEDPADGTREWVARNGWKLVGDSAETAEREWLTWNGKPYGSNTEIRARLTLVPSESPVRGARFILAPSRESSGWYVDPGVEIVLETNRVGIAVGPGEWEAGGGWALVGLETGPAGPTEWFPRRRPGPDLDVRIAFCRGEAAVWLDGARDPALHTDRIYESFLPGNFRDPGSFHVVATGVRISGLAIRPADPAEMPPLPPRTVALDVLAADLPAAALDDPAFDPLYGGRDRPAGSGRFRPGSFAGFRGSRADALLDAATNAPGARVARFPRRETPDGVPVRLGPSPVRAAAAPDAEWLELVPRIEGRGARIELDATLRPGRRPGDAPETARLGFRSGQTYVLVRPRHLPGDPDSAPSRALLVFLTALARGGGPDPAPPPPVPADLAAGGPPSPAIPPQQSRLVDAVLFLTWLETGPGEDPVAAVPHLRDYSAFSPDPATRAFVAAATNLHASDAAVRVGIGSDAWWNDTWCLPVVQGETVAALCSIDLSPPDADGLSDVRVETAFAEKRGEIVDGDRISARFETRARLRSFDDESLVLGPIPAGHVSTNANARAWLVVAWDHAEEEPHAEGAESDSRTVPAAPQPRDPADAVLFLKCFEADAGAAPAACLPHVGEGKVFDAPDPATRAFLVSGTNDLAGVVARDSSIIEADWGRPAFQKTVQQSWRAPACKTESLLWNVIVSNPGPDGDIVFCRVEATLSGNPDPAPDAECVQVRVKALAPLPRGDRLVLGPIPAGHVSTNANARAWLVVAWDHAEQEPHAAATPDSVIAPPTVLP